MTIEYVNNKDLLKAIIEYKKELENDSSSKVSPIIAKAVTQIAQKLSNRHNFINYTFKEEMVGDAIVDCIKYISKFNPEKSSNPFGYITQICWNAFVRRIQKENSQFMVKAKYAHRLAMGTDLISQIDEHTKEGSGDDFENDYSAYLNSYYTEYVDEYEKKLLEKQRSSRAQQSVAVESLKEQADLDSESIEKLLTGE